MELVADFGFCKDTTRRHDCPEDWWKKEEPIRYDEAYRPKASEEEPSLEEEFNRLATAWKSVSGGTQSSVSRIVTHPAYLEIISKGERMIPFILRDLQKEPNHWFIAL